MASKSYYKKKDKVYYKYNCHCAYCGIYLKINDLYIDHIIPISRFPEMINNKSDIPEYLEHLNINDVHHIDNLNPACFDCNTLKGNLSLQIFKNKLKSNFYYANTNSKLQRFRFRGNL